MNWLFSSSRASSARKAHVAPLRFDSLKELGQKLPRVRAGYVNDQNGRSSTKPVMRMVNGKNLEASALSFRWQNCAPSANFHHHCNTLRWKCLWDMHVNWSVAAFDVGPLFATALVVAYMDTHVAWWALLLATCSVVVMQTNEFPSLSLGDAIGRHWLKKIFDSLPTWFTSLASLVFVVTSWRKGLWWVICCSFGSPWSRRGRRHWVLNPTSCGWQWCHVAQDLWWFPERFNMPIQRGIGSDSNTQCTSCFLRHQRPKLLICIEHLLNCHVPVSTWRRSHCSMHHLSMPLLQSIEAAKACLVKGQRLPSEGLPQLELTCCVARQVSRFLANLQVALGIKGHWLLCFLVLYLIVPWKTFFRRDMGQNSIFQHGVCLVSQAMGRFQELVQHQPSQLLFLSLDSNHALSQREGFGSIQWGLFDPFFQLSHCYGVCFKPKLPESNHRNRCYFPPKQVYQRLLKLAIVTWGWVCSAHISQFAKTVQARCHHFGEGSIRDSNLFGTFFKASFRFHGTAKSQQGCQVQQTLANMPANVQLTHVKLTQNISLDITANFTNSKIRVAKKWNMSMFEWVPSFHLGKIPPSRNSRVA